MGSKKKKKTPKPKQRDKSKVDERLKLVTSFQAEDADAFKIENEKRLESFMRYGIRRHVKKFGKLTIREQKKFSRRTHRRIAPMPWKRKKKRI